MSRSLAHFPCWYAGHYGVWFHILSHNTTSAANRPLTNMHSRQHYHIATKPHPVVYLHGKLYLVLGRAIKVGGSVVVLKRIDGHITRKVYIAPHGKAATGVENGIVANDGAIAKRQPFGTPHLRLEMYRDVSPHLHAKPLIQPFPDMIGGESGNLVKYESPPPQNT